MSSVSGATRPEPFHRVDAVSREEAASETAFQRAVLDALGQLDQGQRKLFTGQTELTEAFGALVPRVSKLESDAKWKGRMVIVAKAAAPFVLGLAAHYIPALAEHIPGILKAISGL